MAEFPAPTGGIVLTHFIVASDVGRSRCFYSDVLGGEVLREGEPSIVALANSWIVINVGGPPTDDKPTLTLEPPRDPGHVSSFLNIRVADTHAVYQQCRRDPRASAGLAAEQRYLTLRAAQLHPPRPPGFQPN
jgi:hypothetical protein